MTSTDRLESRLFELYGRYVGEPDARTDVYAGFALFFGALAVGVLGLSVFLASAGVERGTGLFWNLRGIAVVLALVGLPSLMLSVVVLLPVDRRALYAAGGGLTVCLIALAVFVAAYPSNWNVSGQADYSAHGIALYSVGLAVVVAATGAALVAHHLDRVRPGDEGSGEPGEEVSDEQVARDIESAMSGVDLSWGGVSRRKTKRLRLTESEEVDRSGFDGVEATATRSSGSGVDDAVASLRGLQGGRTKSASGGGTEKQASALTELRERKRMEALATAEPSPLSRIADRIKALLP
ncbi:DUF7139 domain-containing protein [Natronorarus salvus]|uniref:DUF7139 domain-containing protein n=1 Tax=Natronorarus salvus TaxID=3117733 RepID=UPI002F26D0B8